MKKHIISLFTMMAAFLAVTSCSDDKLPVTGSSAGTFTPKGEIVDAYLDLTVADLSIKMTTRAVAEDSEAERTVNNIWVFQYDRESGDLINTPTYYKIDEQEQLAHLEDLINISVTLSDNNGDPCIIYVVANTDDEGWVSGDEDTGYPGFDSLDELKEQEIPNPAPIRVNTSDIEDGDISSEADLSIPMGGSRGDTGDDELIVKKEGDRITIPVARMFAKLYVTINLLNEEGYESTMSYLMIDKIPNACTVAKTETEGTWYYPGNYEVSRAFTPDDDTTTSIDGGTDGTKYGPFIMYVPESYQESETDAIKLTPYLKVTITGDNAVITPSPSYTAYPGSWSASTGSPAFNENHGDNYEIRRNNIYDITLTINAKDDITPCANCLIATAGETIAFYPYERDETMSSELQAEADKDSEVKERYTYSNYLNYSYEGDDATDGKKIKSVKIIWQTDGCIGNNDPENGGSELVWIDPEPDASYDAEQKTYVEHHRKIYVKTAKPGNALIAAYDGENGTGNILWSWHIWVPNDGVDPEAGAIEYYHYDWNSTTGIDTKRFVLGRLVMNLNLGALAEKPETRGVLDTETYGMLYQWGRKDPFPPMQTTPDYPGVKASPGLYDYADYEVDGGDDRQYTVKIGMHDNANVSVPMVGNDGEAGTVDKSTGLPYLFNTEVTATYGTTDNDVIQQSIKHPTTFIAALDGWHTTSQANLSDITKYYNEGDWLPDNDDFLWGGGHPGNGEYQVYNQNDYDENDSETYEIDAYLEDDYGPNKTIFDPCPYGWRVAAGDIWLGMTDNGKNVNSGRGSELGATNASDIWYRFNVDQTETPEDVAKQTGYTMHMQGWHTGATSFFPTQGSRCPSGRPYLIGGVCGNYHNATVDQRMNYKNTGNYIRRVDIIHFHTQNTKNETKEYVDGQWAIIKPFTDELYYYVKSVAGPLRCVRDTK